MTLVHLLDQTDTAANTCKPVVNLGNPELKRTHHIKLQIQLSGRL